jgi:enediyne biosynthesis protein E4
MRIYFGILFLFFLVGCKKEFNNYKFRLLTAESTNLKFANTLTQTNDLNVLNYMYFYNGGGLGSGDFNNDGKLDAFFTSNQGPNKLFLNEGGLKFKDVTIKTGILFDPKVPKWSNGVSIIDINNDGMLDIYINNIGSHLKIEGVNQLYVCTKIENGIPYYVDQAAQYGLNLKGFATQTAFFDFDLDGDLDVFQLNHSLHQNGTFGPRKVFKDKQDSLSGDKLLRNEIINKKGISNKKFKEVTKEAGILSTVVGYGLGIVTGDINNDGWPDIYIGNDFHENDYLYINQKDGSFKEVLTERIKHTSRFSMGVDMADINNDGWSEIMSLDMMPENNEILRRSLGEDGFAVYQFKLGYGYNEQFARNSLQLNNADANWQNDNVPSFSEIAMFSKVSATDWSWASLFFDFDFDGYNDLFVSNGIPRRMNDIDYTNFMNNEGKTVFDSNKKLDVIEKMPQIKIANKFFENNKNLQFNDIENLIKNKKDSYSNGSVYGDFDGDGDLDVLVNNIEDEPFLYENLNNKSNKHLQLKLTGSPHNRDAIGSRIIIFKKDKSIITQEKFPVRGFQSSMNHDIAVGIGDSSKVDSIILVWPDRSYQKINKIAYGKTQTIKWKEQLPIFNFGCFRKLQKDQYALKRISDTTKLNFTHIENSFIEFNRESLLPHMLSMEGPALAIGDLNGDNIDDVFFGSSKWKQNEIHFQNLEGKFKLKTSAVIANDSIYEDVDAIIADIDNDNDNDILVVAGGNEFKLKEEACKQRYYINQGNGIFEKRYFDNIYMTGSCIAICDFDNDGLKDVFLGARSIPFNYGKTPKSALLKNLGNGNFKNISNNFPQLRDAGMVKSAEWSDVDGDKDHDLVLAMEWSEIIIFENKEKNTLHKKLISKDKGWWNVVKCYDYDQDGDVDILAGNTGLNGRFQPTQKEPIKLYISDFDGNGQVEQILTHFQNGKEVPFSTHAELIKQLPYLKKKFLYSKDFAKADVFQLIGKEKLAKSIKREANNFASTYFENDGKGNFVSHPLPIPFQFSTLNAIELTEQNKNGKRQILTGGNFFGCNIEMGRYDGDYGNLLEIGKSGKMSNQSLSYLNIDGQIKKIKAIKTNEGIKYIYLRNNGKAILLERTNSNEFYLPF